MTKHYYHVEASGSQTVTFTADTLTELIPRLTRCLGTVSVVKRFPATIDSPYQEREIFFGPARQGVEYLTLLAEQE